MPTETEQRFSRTGHSSQRDIDDLLAELGYHQPTRREEAPPPPPKREKARKKQEPAPQPKPIQVIQEPEDPPLLDIPIPKAGSEAAPVGT
ncbi:hypothetical protein, partial [Ruminococcus sp.]|uniref:hypothetical protein n=1 Tax=Ruminococcus sp. TaxID=41978 RepID=UPI003F0284E9